MRTTTIEVGTAIAVMGRDLQDVMSAPSSGGLPSPTPGGQGFQGGFVSPPMSQYGAPPPQHMAQPPMGHQQMVHHELPTVGGDGELRELQG